MPKILAIDDKEDNLISISALLNNLIPDCEVITARSGPEGLKKAKAELPDTILVDIKMPKMDGFEVCKRLKSDEDTRGIPVIMLAAIKTDSRSRVKGFQAGAEAFLSNPIEEAELVAQINVMLRIKRAEDVLLKEREILEDMVDERTEALRESEVRYRGIFEHSRNGIAVYRAVNEGEDFIFVDVNKSVQKIEDINREALIGKSVLEVFPGVKEFGLFDVFQRVWATGKPEHHPVKLYEDERITGWRENFVYKLPSGDIVAIYTDETERMKAEKETRQLETMLQQAQKMEAIGTLAGGIAHDFNNILTAIIGYTELEMYKASPGSKTYNNLRQVIKGGQRARELVRQILTFSRQSKQEPRPLLVSPVVKEALKMLRATLPATIEIRQDIHSDSGRAMADPTQVHQVLMNLCTNAAQAMEEKGGLIQVSLTDVEIDSGFAARHPDMNPGPYVRLTVSDTGCGIAPAIMERIFEPYFTTKEKGGGTGLGLAVVHGIVKGHGGGITVYSEPGRGTTFNVFLPRIESEATLETPRLNSLSRGKDRILFVDDEQALVDLGRQMLEFLGYEVLSRRSSIEALEAFKAQPNKFDLVITDLTMPNMTGLELSEKVLAIRPEIPIILCSGFGEGVAGKKAKSIGIRAFIMKPVVMRDLANTIRKVLDN